LGIKCLILLGGVFVAGAVVSKVFIPNKESEIPLLHCEIDINLSSIPYDVVLGPPPSNKVLGYLTETLAAEGGYQTDKDDLGNYRPDGQLVGTNRGITSYALSKFKKVDPNSITASDIKSITEDDAIEIYRQDYFYGPGIDRIPVQLQSSVFDMYINSGSNAIKILQKTIGMPSSKRDGVLGPNTLIKLEASNITTEQYADARIAYYTEVVTKKPKLKKYLSGWIARSNKYR
tara:strand:- start:357 stop:1052 length:696 start_codon:yes stop_codon:yes gene_type:complete